MIILHLCLSNPLIIKPSHHNTKKSIEKSPTALQEKLVLTRMMILNCGPFNDIIVKWWKPHCWHKRWHLLTYDTKVGFFPWGWDVRPKECFSLFLFSKYWCNFDCKLRQHGNVQSGMVTRGKRNWSPTTLCTTNAIEIQFWTYLIRHPKSPVHVE